MTIESAKRQILATATLDFGSIAANTSAELTATVKNVVAGQVVAVSAPDLEDGLVASAYVSAAHTVTVRVANVTAGAVDPASQDYLLAIQ